MDEIKTKLKNKKLLKNILVYFIITVVVILLLNWFVKAQQANINKDQAENLNNYYKGLMARCDQQDKKLSDCCLASVQFMAASNFKIASDIGCEPGFKINTYSCLGSYKWCEMIR